MWFLETYTNKQMNFCDYLWILPLDRWAYTQFTVMSLVASGRADRCLTNSKPKDQLLSLEKNLYIYFLWAFTGPLVDSWEFLFVPKNTWWKPFFQNVHFVCCRDSRPCPLLKLFMSDAMTFVLFISSKLQIVTNNSAWSLKLW